jgi:hypothetical protein
MKTLIKVLIKLIIFSAVIYGLYFSLYKSVSEDFVVLKDSKSNVVMQVYTGSYNFIWQGVMPWKYSVVKMPVKNSSLVNIPVKIPSLSSLNDDSYTIKLPVNISYRIDKSNMPDISYLNSKNGIENYIIEKASLICQSVLMNYIEPVYNRNNILKDEKQIIEIMTSAFMKKIPVIGVIPDSVEFISPGYFPDNKYFSEGLVQNREMRELDFSNKKQEILLAKKLIKDKHENELYYEKLLRVSSILKDNPEILKFIYIDKMGDDIKVIISSDKTGLPAMFNESPDGTKPGVRGDVDNLR